MSGTSGSIAAEKRVEDFLSGWRFPSLVLFLLAYSAAALVALLLVPASDSALGRFAEEFRIWCFGYDPATKRFEWSYLVTMGVQWVMLGAGVIGVWRRPLRAALRRPARLVPPALTALAVVGAGAAGFGLLRPAAAATGELPFPAERLRTSFAAPSLSLVDQDGQPVSLEALRGRVIMVTGVYSTCGYTCPMIMAQAKAAVSALSPAEREQVTVVAVTLDPQHDTPEQLRKMAEAQHVTAPLYRLSTGEPAAVERALDDLQIARERDPKTGVIDHANLFLLVDKRGKIAYRLTLGGRQERWLTQALRVLVAE